MSRELRDRLEALQVELAAFPAELRRVQEETRVACAEVDAVRKERAELDADVAELELSIPKLPRVVDPGPSAPLVSGNALLVGIAVFVVAVFALRWCFS